MDAMDRIHREVIRLANQHQEFTLDNGFHVIIEPRRDVASAAYTLLLPGGIGDDPVGLEGIASLASDLITRGTEKYDSRELAESFDRLGVTHSEQAELAHLSAVGTTLAENLEPALDLLADVILHPTLDETQLGYCRDGMLQDLQSIEDDPGQKLFVELRRRSFEPRFGRSSMGTPESLAAIDQQKVREFLETNLRPNGAILGIAGNVSIEKLKKTIDRLFGSWKPKAHSRCTNAPESFGNTHIESDKVQTQIGICYPAVRYDDPQYFDAHGAISVLSGGSSSRLFTEVREKRGLCYTVSAAYVPMKHAGYVLCHSGTTNDKAQQTLDVLLEELKRIEQGVSDEEVHRARIGLLSSLVMSEESTSARASALARTYYNLGRVRTVAETREQLERMTPDSILNYVRTYPADNSRLLRSDQVHSICPHQSDGDTMHFEQTTLPNGLNIIAEISPDALSTAMAFAVNTGARDEVGSESGVSHFLEHMAFKGDDDMTWDDLNLAFDNIGASQNAYTSEEHTVYHAVVLPEYTRNAWDCSPDCYVQHCVTPTSRPKRK